MPVQHLPLYTETGKERAGKRGEDWRGVCMVVGREGGRKKSGQRGGLKGGEEGQRGGERGERDRDRDRDRESQLNIPGKESLANENTICCFQARPPGNPQKCEVVFRKPVLW